MVETQHRLVQSPSETPRHGTNPHFLFNALNSVEALSRRAPERIPEVVRGLATYLRYCLQPAPDGWATLQEELDALASYLYVEKVRFEDQFEVELDIAEDARPQRIPQFFLQPLVESVLREGIGAGPTPLRVVVGCRRIDGRLRVEVKNSGVGSGRATVRGSGLEDLFRRLELFYKEGGYRWTLSEKPDWVSLSIEIPLET
jgi:LytS/YehU family sensor histidine kinase